MNLCVVGCGDLGGRVARAAAEAGHRVFGARRSGASIGPGVEPLRLDVTDRATLALPPDLDALVYSVAASERSDEGYRLAYPLGLTHVLDALQDPGRVRAIFVSSTAVYGESTGARVDESSPTEPGSFTGARLLEAEALLAAAPLASGSSLRFGGIYGPGRDFLIRQVGNETLTLPAIDEWTNRIHVHDGARAVLHVLGLTEVAPVYNVVDEAPSKRAEVLGFIAERLGIDAPAVDPRRRPGPRGAGKRVSSARLAATGFRWSYPSYREGYGELVGGA